MTRIIAHAGGIRLAAALIATILLSLMINTPSGEAQEQSSPWICVGQDGKVDPKLLSVSPTGGESGSQPKATADCGDQGKGGSAKANGNAKKNADDEKSQSSKKSDSKKDAKPKVSSNGQVKATKPAKDYKKFGQDDDPTTLDGPSQWARAGAQGAQQAANEVQKLLDKNGLGVKFEFTGGYLGLYAMCLALGWIIAVVAVIISTQKLDKVEGRLVLQRAMTRLLAFWTVGPFIPLVIGIAADTAEGLAAGFMTQAKNDLMSAMQGIIVMLAVPSISLFPLTSAVLVGFVWFLIPCLFALILELMAGEYLVYMLGLLLPIIVAASIFQKWAGGLKKVIGAIIGALLAPAAVTFTLAVTMSATKPSIGADDMFSRIAIVAVGLFLTVTAPVAIGIVLSYIVPAFTGGGYESGALSSAVDRNLERASRRHQQSNPRRSRSNRGQNGDRKPGSKAGAGEGATAEAGAAEGGAAGGGALGAAAAPIAIWAAVVKGTRDGLKKAQRGLASAAGHASNSGQGTSGSSPGKSRPGSRADKKRGGGDQKPADQKRAATSTTKGPRAESAPTQRQSGQQQQQPTGQDAPAGDDGANTGPEQSQQPQQVRQEPEQQVQATSSSDAPAPAPQDPRAGGGRGEPQDVPVEQGSSDQQPSYQESLIDDPATPRREPANDTPSSERSQQPEPAPVGHPYRRSVAWQETTTPPFAPPPARQNVPAPQARQQDLNRPASPQPQPRPQDPPRRTE